MIRTGDQLPVVHLAELELNEVRSAPAPFLFANKRCVVVGVPGAFSPVCSRVHLPRFVEMAPAMKASGFDMIAVIAPNDPWVLAEWSARIDPEGRLRFFSDGALEFGLACGLTERIDDLFMGLRLRRFSMIVRDTVVQKLQVETSVLEVGCTRAEFCLPDLEDAA